MQLPPISVIATWPQSNYVNPSEVRGPTIIILTLVFLPLLVILIALRIYTRLRLSKNFGADDIAIIAAVFPTAACAILALVAVLHYGWSRHVWDVPPDQLVTGLKFVIAVEILFVTGASLTKVSMLLLINRIMAGGSGTLRWISMALMIIVCADCVIYLIVAINTCSPVSEYWTLSFAPQNCINERVHLLAGGIINTTTDFCVVLIPIPVVLKLRLPLRQRIACAMLFGAGFIVCIAAGVRMYYTWQLNTTYDKTWLAYPVWISGTVELYLGIIATSIPAIKPLISRYFPKMLGGSSNFSKYGQPSLNSYVMRSNNDPRLESPSHLTDQTPLAAKSTDNNNNNNIFCETVTTITTVTAGRSNSSSNKRLSFSPSPLSLQLPLSQQQQQSASAPFSTYKKGSGAEREVRSGLTGNDVSNGGSEWNRTTAVAPSWEKTVSDESSKTTSLSSFEVGRQSILEGEVGHTGGVDAHADADADADVARRMESRENLVVRGLGGR